jgi:SAM-dependent methyltransferase
MNEVCPICDSENIAIRCEYRGVHSAFIGLGRSHCSTCGMVFASPMPSDTVLEEYNASYFATAHGGQPRNKAALGFFLGIAHLRLAHIERYLAIQNIVVSSLLELGPGAGFFASKWLERYPKTNYLACETDASCHADLHEIGVDLLQTTALMEDGNAIDLVVMSHVLEHVSDPVRFLSEATQNLNKGGALFIEVPCRDYEHKPIDEPHLLFFEKESMQHLLKKLGFDNIQVSYHGQKIEELGSNSFFQIKWMALRSRLISLGLIAPFSSVRPGMEMLSNPIERAMVAPFEAHRESSQPAWWLRALATKC